MLSSIGGCDSNPKSFKCKFPPVTTYTSVSRSYYYPYPSRLSVSFISKSLAVVVAHLTERSPPIPGNPGSNPVTGNFYWTFIYCLLFVEKTKNKELGLGMAPLLKISCTSYLNWLIVYERDDHQVVGLNLTCRNTEDVSLSWNWHIMLFELVSLKMHLQKSTTDLPTLVK